MQDAGEKLVEVKSLIVDSRVNIEKSLGNFRYELTVMSEEGLGLLEGGGK